jgi:hypothetical protein
VQEKHLVARGRQITIRTEPGNVRLFIDDEEIRIRHHQGEKPFSTPYLPHVHYDFAGPASIPRRRTVGIEPR